MKEKHNNYEDMENPNKLQDEMIKKWMMEINWTKVGMYVRKKITKKQRREKATD